MANYGIGELYGYRMRDPSTGALQEWAKGINNGHFCPFQKKPEGGLRLCNKPGGVCSITEYVEGKPSQENPFIVTCPNRFKEADLIFGSVAETLFSTGAFATMRELDYLQPAIDEAQEPNEEPGEEISVGRIDSIVVAIDQGEIVDWCALEIQAVYFSGQQMGAECRLAAKNALKLLNSGAEGDVYEYAAAGSRRPDFRSSGPKRLLPQLEVKVPTLSRWGKKTVVVIDKPFFNSIRRGIRRANSISNADIVWMIYEVQSAATEQG